MRPPWYRLLLCRLLGHRWSEDGRGDPVIPLFLACRRCGKFHRLLTG